MVLNSRHPFDVKMVKIQKASEAEKMTKAEIPQENMNINAFISASREYLALPNRRSAANQQAFVSFTTVKAPRTQMSPYRRVVQSFLLAAGLGTLAAGPAMADRGYGHPRGNTERHAKMLEQHHNRLHDALKLTAEQEPGWKKLIDSEHPGATLSGGQPEDWAKLTAPERAEKMLELSKARQVQMAEHVAALKTFYAALTPEQQNIYEDFHTGSRSGRAGNPSPKASSTGKAPDKP